MRPPTSSTRRRLTWIGPGHSWLAAAITSYEDALRREREFPNLRTSAYIDFACLVVNEHVASLYPRALEGLNERPEDPLRPIELYLKSGARALLLLGLGQADEAASAVEVAVLQAAGQVHSGFRYHTNLGLVGDTKDEFGRRVATLARRRVQA